jgi:predicted RND superfamily exporter protein
MRDLPAWLYARRHWAGAAFLIITAFFAFELHNLEIATQFHDLYPQNSEAVRLLEKYPAFGSPFTETILIKVKHGDIYNPVTLSKIQEATRLIDLIPGVDHNQIISIASRRVRHIEAVVGGIQSTNLLIGAVPQSQSQLADLRDRVRSTPGVTGTLVSFNGDAAVIQATFIDHLIDYKVVFDRTNQIIRRLEDSNHDVYAFGQPMLADGMGLPLSAADLCDVHARTRRDGSTAGVVLQERHRRSGPDPCRMRQCDLGFRLGRSGRFQSRPPYSRCADSVGGARAEPLGADVRAVL